MNRGDRREAHTRGVGPPREEEQGEFGQPDEPLQIQRKGGKRKVAIAARLRQETPMTLKWIAEHVAMGSASNVANLLAARRKRTK